jgi:Na+/melibiose symporter-like transporter
MGVIADRTNTRWGKFRPWLLWTALPFGIIGTLAFTTPNFGLLGKIIYAWITYALLRIVYTMNNVPYASLNAVMTLDPDERTSISSYRQIAANTAGFIVASLAIPMVGIFGHGNDARGYQRTMGLPAAEDLAGPGRFRPLPEPTLGGAFSGHVVLFHRHSGAR